MGKVIPLNRPTVVMDVVYIDPQEALLAMFEQLRAACVTLHGRGYRRVRLNISVEGIERKQHKKHGKAPQR